MSTYTCARPCMYIHTLPLKKKKQWQAINILYFFCHLMTLSHLIHRIVCVCVCVSHSLMSNSSPPHGL